MLDSLLSAGVVNPQLRAQLVAWTGLVTFPQLLGAGLACGAVAIYLRYRERRAFMMMLAGGLSALLLLAAGGHFFATLFLEQHQRATESVKAKR
jgi:hypothetical protein